MVRLNSIINHNPRFGRVWSGRIRFGAVGLGMVGFGKAWYGGEMI